MATTAKPHQAAVSLCTKVPPTSSSPFTELMLCQQVVKASVKR